MYFPGKISQAFKQQRAEANTHIKRLEKTLKDLPEDQVFNRMSLEMRLKQLYLALDWLDECEGNFRAVGN
jgi:hypothetical protein